MTLRRVRQPRFNPLRALPALLAIVLLTVPGPTWPICQCSPAFADHSQEASAPESGGCCAVARPSKSGCCNSDGSSEQSDPDPEHPHKGSCCDYCASPCCTVQSVVHIPFDLDLHADAASQAVHFLYAQPASSTLDDVWHPPRA